MSSEARCKDCGLDYAAFGLDLVLPDDQWRAVNGGEGGGLLCATCIARRVDLWQGNVVLSARIVTGDDHEAFARTKNLSNHELFDKMVERAAIAEKMIRLVDHWRAEAIQRDAIHSVMALGWKTCADELERVFSCSPTLGSSHALKGRSPHE